MSTALVVAEVFPPAIGGSGELLANVYARLGNVHVLVLTTESDRANEVNAPFEVMRRLSPTRHWGALHPVGLVQHLTRAVQIRRLSTAGSVVHCARALPEGLAAWAARTMGGSPYVCWAHGEEIAYCRDSRELTRLMKRIYRGAACVIANSRNTAESVAAIGVPSDRLVVVYPGVDVGRFRPDVPNRDVVRASYANADDVLLLTVGRLQQRKGHDLVLDAFSRLRYEHPNLRYVIVGDGEERSTLERVIRERGLSDCVTLTGAVPSEELPAFYAAADIFVHPNRVVGSDFEGFGIVFLEAAAAGLPVIAGRSGGAPEAVDENVTGLLVSGTDPDELGRAIVSLSVDPVMRRRMGDAGRARASTEFSWAHAGTLVGAIHERAAHH